MIDNLSGEMIQNISFVKRDLITGCSTVSLLEDKENLARLMAAGTVGDMMINNQI